ncbi:MAG TPA: PRTRC system protein E [Edaphobacter sp.]|uniref:PRTRC system protein E n=1 Tax=Edaphobacter sp. TaxID=1934404 RepID=UPI002C4CC2B0|nr:PRTRC system protein E [Edaphobacter sp.]HUZ96758.1 PRTRC system protein E [Edaphobacter sp.]
MFKELKPLLTKRSLVLTLSSVGDDQLRVTITPRPTGKEEAKELTQPFAVEGTAEELDTGLSGAIVSYTAEHLTLERSVAQIKTNMEAALKEVKDEAAKKVAEARKSGKGTSSTKTEIAAKPEVSAKPEVKKPDPPSLFDTPAELSKAAPNSPSESAKAALEENHSDDSGIAATSAARAAQPAMFDTQSDEEDEILREAFHGTDDDSAAA